MQNKTTSFRDPVANEPSTVGEKLSATAAQVKDKVSDLGRTAADKIDENRDAAADSKKPRRRFMKKPRAYPAAKRLAVWRTRRPKN